MYNNGYTYKACNCRKCFVLLVVAIVVVSVMASRCRCLVLQSKTSIMVYYICIKFFVYYVFEKYVTYT